MSGPDFAALPTATPVIEPRTLKGFRDYLPEFFVLPHPSWRNKAWLKKNPWFADEVIPALRRRVRGCIGPL